MDPIRIERALISVSDKRGLIEFAQSLAATGTELYGSGGTRKHLQDAGLAVREIADYTGFPEMMDGRLKTLHPRVHGGILCRRDNPQDMAALVPQGIVPFDLVVVNLYPFAETVARPGVTDAEAIEQIDIGGPSLIRGAAKNHKFVAIATSPDQYPRILEQLQQSGGTTIELRRDLASEAFALTFRYDRMISDYFAGQTTADSFPPTVHLSFRRREVLRYGENPHQPAALYAGKSSSGHNTLVGARQLNGKELSYNNLLDLDSALAIVRSLPSAAAAVVKHNNPCGAAVAMQSDVAMRQAMDGDPVSAFGSVLGLNVPLDSATAEVLVEPNRFVEAIIAPSFNADALEILTTRPKWKANVRLIEYGPMRPETASWQFRPIDGGMLMQAADVLPENETEWRIVTVARPTDAQFADLRFAWSIVRHVKSNAIVLCRDQTLWGAGAGQMSRVDSVRIAIEKAGPRGAGGALASDAFFPFADSIDLLAAADVKCVIQPGGSRKDDEVIAACDRYGISMIFTGQRHFRH